MEYSQFGEEPSKEQSKFDKWLEEHSFYAGLIALTLCAFIMMILMIILSRYGNVR